MKRPRYKNKKWLIKQYCGKRLSALEIAKKCGVHKSVIYYWLKKFGIAIRDTGEARRSKTFKRKKRKHLNSITREVLIAEYVIGQDSMKAIAERHGCSESYVRNQLIKNNIEIREQFGRNIPLDQRSDSWLRRKAREAYEEFWREPPREGFVIHHFDRDLTNYDITNLPVITRSTHNKIHAKERGEKKLYQIQWQDTQEPVQAAA